MSVRLGRTFVRLFFFGTLIASRSAFALPSGDLSKFEMSSCNSVYCAVITGAKASLSKFGDVMAAASVKINVETKAGIKTTYACSSFTYDVILDYANCEVVGLHQRRIVLDFASHEVRALAL